MAAIVVRPGPTPNTNNVFVLAGRTSATRGSATNTFAAAPANVRTRPLPDSNVRVCRLPLCSVTGRGRVCAWVSAGAPTKTALTRSQPMALYRSLSRPESRLAGVFSHVAIRRPSGEEHLKHGVRTDTGIVRTCIPCCRPRLQIRACCSSLVWVKRCQARRLRHRPRWCPPSPRTARARKIVLQG